MKIKIGKMAPDFELPNQKGESIRLSSFRGKKSVVLYFYPKDETAGCTAQACSFRDRYEAFLEAGAQVIGVISDSIESHKNFSQKYRLSFPIVADEGGKLRGCYGATTFGILPGRVTFVIDKRGIVRHIFSSQFRPKKHIEEALGILAAKK